MYNHLLYFPTNYLFSYLYRGPIYYKIDYQGETKY